MTGVRIPTLVDKSNQSLVSLPIHAVIRVWILVSREVTGYLQDLLMSLVDRHQQIGELPQAIKDEKAGGSARKNAVNHFVGPSPVHGNGAKEGGTALS